MVSTLSDHDLRGLPLRALVACATRAAMRVQPYVDVTSAPDGGQMEKPEDLARFALLIAELFCREGFHKPSRLSAMGEDGLWSQDDVASTDGDNASRAANHAYSAAMGAGFGMAVFDGIATSYTAQLVLKDSVEAIKFALLSANSESIYQKMEHAVLGDYKKLLELGLGTFPEIGDFVEMSEAGPLGPLWPDDATFQASQAQVNLHLKNTEIEGSSKEETEKPRSIFKYVSQKTLLIILSNRKILCSPPISFNDPFDCQLYSVYKFSKKQFLEHLRQEIREISDSCSQIGDLYTVDECKKYLVNILTTPNNITLAIKPQEETVKIQSANKLLYSLIVLASHKIIISWEDVNKIIDILEQSDFYIVNFDIERRILEYIGKSLRVFCVSEICDNLLMWSHYADHHRGAVIEMDYNNINLLSSMSDRVIYSKTIPESEKIHNYVKIYLGLNTQCLKNYRNRLIFTKSLDWSYEREWRFLLPKKMVPQDNLIDIPASSIRSIFLGCKFDQTKINEVISLVEDKWTQANIFVSRKDKFFYGLNFAPIRTATRRDESGPVALKRQKKLYEDCKNSFLSVFNQAVLTGLGQTEIPDQILYDTMRLRCELGLSSTYDIKKTYEDMITLAIDTTLRHDTKNDFANIDEREAIRRNELKPSATLYNKFERLTNAHVEALESRSVAA